MQTAWQVEGRACKCLKNMPCKAAFTILYSVPDEEHTTFGTFRRQEGVN